MAAELGGIRLPSVHGECALPNESVITPRLRWLFALLVCIACKPALSPRGDSVPAALQFAAPDSFVVGFETTHGTFEVMLLRALAPHGVDRIHHLVSTGYYDGSRFYRIVPGFVAQAGMARDPRVSAVWQDQPVPVEPALTSNRRGTIALGRFPPVGPTSILYINLVDNVRLDTLRGGYSPIGQVLGNGMTVVDGLYAGYGNHPPQGLGPWRDSVRLQGEAYLARLFPRLDVITRARVAREWR